METKRCTHCGEDKPLDQFSKNRNKLDGLQSWCRSCKKDHDHVYFQTSLPRRERLKKTNSEALDARRRQALEYLQNHSCVDCGEADPVVLDFDHVRGVKKAAVSVLVRGSYSWETILEEIEKCEVRCANCHRRKTAAEVGWFKSPRNPDG